jgi:hypothetical protein
MQAAAVARRTSKRLHDEHNGMVAEIRAQLAAKGARGYAEEAAHAALLAREASKSIQLIIERGR